jgi:hypothetical protein
VADERHRPARRARMTGWRVFVRGVGVGATASYFLDPDEGPRRRALFRERVADWTRRGLGELEADLGDVTRRLAGVVATIRRIARGTPPRIDDQAIAERLATQLGRLEHPDSVTFDVRERRVHLRGVVLPRDAERARRAVGRPGVAGAATWPRARDTARDGGVGDGSAGACGAPCRSGPNGPHERARDLRRRGRERGAHPGAGSRLGIVLRRASLDGPLCVSELVIDDGDFMHTRTPLMV